MAILFRSISLTTEGRPRAALGPPPKAAVDRPSVACEIDLHGVVMVSSPQGPDLDLFDLIHILLELVFHDVILDLSLDVLSAHEVFEPDQASLFGWRPLFASL